MRKFRLLILITVICRSIIGHLVAQPNITSTEFIQQYIAVVNTNNGVTSFTNDFKTAWLEELQLRTRTSEFDIDQQRYSLRFKPSTKKIRSAQTNLSNLIEKEFLLKKTDLGNSLLVVAYQDWLELVMLKRNVAIHKDLLVIYEDIEKVLLKLSQYEQLNVKDFLEVKSEITNSNIIIQSSEKIISDYLAETQINDANFLSIKGVKSNLVQQLSSSPSINSKQQGKNKKAILEAEMALEIAEQQRLFDFFQVQYDGPHTEEWKERVSIGASINIPISSKPTLKMQELELEQLLLSEEIQVDQIVNRKKINRKKIKLERLLDNYELTQAALEVQQEEAFKILSKMTQKEGVTPLLLLYSKVEERKQALDLLKLELDIYTTYIDFLDISESLYVVPFRDFFVAGE